jgi:hypothetical protein
MRRVALAVTAALAAISISPAPVSAQQFTGQGFPSVGFTGNHHRAFPRAVAPDRRGFDCDSRDGRHERRRRSDCGDTFFPWYGGEWALYNNRSWDSDSYNDWWHDRPDRAYPRWVRHNQGCDPERMWWSGEGWHC